MSIKQVTPGVYNYGAYANPKQVKYNTKGIEAMGKAISMGVEAAGEYLKENKERLDTLNEAIGAYTAEIGDFNFGEQNLAIANGTEEYAAWIKNSNKLLRKDPQKYYTEKAQFDNQQANALALKDLISGAEAAIEGIRLEDVDPRDREKYLNMLQIANRSFKMKYDKDKGYVLNLSNIDFGDPSSAEFIQNPIAGASLSEDIKLSDLLNKFDSYTKFGLKFNQNDENFQKSLANMGKLYDDNISKLFLKEGGGTRETISYEEMESDFKDSPHLDLLFSQYGEDIMVSMGMDEEQTRQYLSDMVLGMHVKQYGDKITRKQPSSGSGSGGDLIPIEMAKKDAQELVDMIRRDTVSSQDDPKGIVRYLKSIYSPEYVKRKGKNIEILQDQIDKDEDGNEITERVVVASYDLNRKEEVARLAKDVIDSKVPYESYGKSFEKAAVRKNIEEQVDKYIQSLRGERMQQNNIFFAPPSEENSNEMGPANQEKTGKYDNI